MLLSKKSAAVYAEQLKQLIYDSNSSLNAESHSVIDDIIVQPGSKILSYLHSLLYYMDLLFQLDLTTIESDTQLLDDLKTLFSLTSSQLSERIEADVDRIAATYSLSRVEGTEARGYCRFYTQKSSDLSIPSGTQVSTMTSPVITFQTINDIVNLIPQYDGTTGLYYIDVAIKCTEVGVKGNLQPNRITKLVTPVPGIVAVNNVLSTTGGSDKETNSVLASRIASKKSGRNLPTRPGYKNLVLGSGLVLDVYVATVKSDPTLVTRGSLNAADIFVISYQHPTPAQDTISVPAAVYMYQTRFIPEEQTTYPPPSSETYIEIILSKQPVLRIVSVERDGSTVDPSEYSLVKDTGPKSGSVEAYDKLRIPNTGSSLTITYEYDASIQEIQNLLDHEDNQVVNSNVLARLGTEILIDINLLVSVFSGYDAASVKATIESDLEKFFEGGTTSYGEVFSPKLFGEKVDKSDLLRVVLNVEGVDSVPVDDFEVSYAGIEIVTSLNLSVVQYARLGSVTWK